MAHHDSMWYPRSQGAATYDHNGEARRYQAPSHFVSPSEYLHQDYIPSRRHLEAPRFENTREHQSSMRPGPNPGSALERHEHDYRSPYHEYNENLVPHSGGHHYGDRHPPALSLSPATRRRAADIAPPPPRFSLERRDQREQYRDHRYQEESPTSSHIRPTAGNVHTHDPNSYPNRDHIIRLSRSHDSGVSASAASVNDPKETQNDNSNEQAALSDALLLASVASMARTETKKEGPEPSTAGASSNTMIHGTVTNNTAKLANNRIKTPSPTTTVPNSFKAVTPSLSSKFVNELLKNKKEDRVEPNDASTELRGKISKVISEDLAVSTSGPVLAAIKNTRNYEERDVPLRHPLSKASKSFSKSSDYLKLDRRVEEHPSCEPIKRRDFPMKRVIDLDARSEFQGRQRYAHDEELSPRCTAPYSQTSHHRPPVRYPGPGSYYNEDRGPYPPLSRRENYRPPYVDREEHYHRLPPRQMHSYYPPPPPLSMRREEHPYFHRRPSYYLPPPSTHGPQPPIYLGRNEENDGHAGFNYHDGFRPPTQYDERQPEPFNSIGKIILRRKCAWKNYPELETFLIENRDEYLRHSAMNYTQKQKQFNNELTDRLLEVANRHNYVFDPTEFNFVAIRDRIRCYYKSFVQNCKKKGIAIGQKGGKKRKVSEALEHDDDAIGSQPVEKRVLQESSCGTAQYATPGIAIEEKGCA